MIDVDKLPRRTAHAVYALIFASLPGGGGGYGPFTSYEVCIYDPEALTVMHTAAALRAAQRAGLVVYVPGGEGYWTPTNATLDQKRDFEDRYCRDTKEEGDE